MNLGDVEEVQLSVGGDFGDGVVHQVDARCRDAQLLRPDGGAFTFVHHQRVDVDGGVGRAHGREVDLEHLLRRSQERRRYLEHVPVSPLPLTKTHSFFDYFHVILYHSTALLKLYLRFF